MEKRILALFDTHIPENISLYPIFEFAKDFKPNILVLGGDMHDFGSVSHWLADQSKHLDKGIMIDNYQELRDVLLTPIAVAVGKKCRKIYLEGNHEYWIVKATAIDPNLRGYVELENNLPKEFEIVPINKPFRAGDNLVYVHGVYTNMYHARKHVDAFHTSVIYGHLHEIQSFSMVSPVDSEKFYKAQSIGCLCNLNPGYKKNRPNSWVHGFSYAYVDDDGSFSDIPVVIVKNRFWANGRRYKP